MAEGLGTLILVLFGSMAVVAADRLESLQVILVSLGFGLGLFVALYSVGEVARRRHFNPAVTWAAFLDGRLGGGEMLVSWLVQCLGGVAASLLLAAFSSTPAVARTVTTTTEIGSVFLVEVLTSTFFVMVVLGATRFTRLRSDALVAMSVSYVGIHLVGLPFGGGSVNPARSLGPAIVTLTWTGLWVFLAAPMAGASLGWFLFRLLNVGELDVYG